MSVNDGKVILSGDIGTWSEHKAAVENAFDAGATAVISYLAVAESPGSENHACFYNQDPR